MGAELVNRKLGIKMDNWEITKINLKDMKQLNVHDTKKVICTMYIEDKITNEVEANAKLIAAAPKMFEALAQIANWELPETNRFWDDAKEEPMSFNALHGSNGVRDYFKSLAHDAIKDM